MRQLGHRGICVHVVGVSLKNVASGDAVKIGKSTGVHVVMYLVDKRGEPVGGAAQWPTRPRVSPIWNSALPVGASSSAPASSSHLKLAVELWETGESGRHGHRYPCARDTPLPSKAAAPLQPLPPNRPPASLSTLPHCNATSPPRSLRHLVTVYCLPVPPSCLSRIILREVGCTCPSLCRW